MASFLSLRKAIKCLSLSTIWKETHSLQLKHQTNRETYLYLRCICGQSDYPETVESFNRKSRERPINANEVTQNQGSVIARISHGKTINVVVTSLRIDRVTASGLGMGRKKLQYAILGGKLFLNKEKVDKGSVLVWSSDKIDVISDNQTDTGKVVFSRVELDNVGELTSKGRTNLTLTRYKRLVKARSDFEKEYKT